MKKYFYLRIEYFSSNSVTLFVHIFNSVFLININLNNRMIISDKY